MIPLKIATAQVRSILLVDSNGAALTGASPTVLIAKGAGNLLAIDGTVAEDNATGRYKISFTANDTDTQGPVGVSVTAASALDVFIETEVQSADTWEAIHGDGTAGRMSVSIPLIHEGTAVTTGVNTITLAAPNRPDGINDASILITGSDSGTGQVRKVSSYSGKITGIVTVSENWSPALGGGAVTYAVIPNWMVSKLVDATNIVTGGAISTISGQVGTVLQTKRLRGYTANFTIASIPTPDTVIEINEGIVEDDQYKDAMLYILDEDVGDVAYRRIVSSNASANTITIDSNPPFSLDLADELVVMAGESFVYTKAADVEADTQDIQTTLAGLNDITAGDVVTALMAQAIESGITFQEAVVGFVSVLLNEASGLDTNTPTFRDFADSKNRLAYTTDANGNRTARTTADLS